MLSPIVLLASLLPTSSDETVIELWPGGAPGALGIEEKDRPRLRVWSPEGDNSGVAVMVCPGGGYGHLAMGHEGEQVAAWLNEHGITAAVLDYRHRGKGYGHPAPLLDAQRGMRMVRAHAEVLGIDTARVGVLGFSAGGHLAATVTTLYDRGPNPAREDGSTDDVDRLSARPDFSVLVYAVLLTDGPHHHRGSIRNLLGESPDSQTLRWLSPIRQVDERTPPTFLITADDDRGVPPENSIAFYQACRRHGLSTELHVWRRGGHGFGLGREGQPVKEWPGRCIDWLRDREVLR